MKKILAMILALMLVFTLAAGIVVMADEPVEATNGTEAQDLVEQNQPATPSEEDMANVKEYIVFDFTDRANIVRTNYIVGSDSVRDYLKAMYSSYYNMEMTDDVYNGEKALSMTPVSMTAEELGDSGVVYISKDYFLAKKETIAYPFGTMLNNGAENGQLVCTVVFKFGNDVKEYKVLVGEQNSILFAKYTFNWINILIVMMCLIVLILLVVILAVLSKKKKNANKDDENSQFVEVEDIYSTLMNESENTEVCEEVVEEVVEEAVEEVAEELAEEITEENTEDK